MSRKLSKRQSKEMPTLDDIRKKKLDELMRHQQGNLQQQAQEESQAQQQIEAMEAIVKKLFTKEALVRYGSLKSAHQENALRLLMILFQAIQKNQIRSKIDDSTLKKILEQLTPQKRDIIIKRV